MANIVVQLKQKLKNDFKFQNFGAKFCEKRSLESNRFSVTATFSVVSSGRLQYPQGPTTATTQKQQQGAEDIRQ